MLSPLAIGLILLGAPPQPVRVVDQSPAPVRRSLRDEPATPATARVAAEARVIVEPKAETPTPARVSVQTVSRRLRRPTVRQAFIPQDAAPIESTVEAPLPDHAPVPDELDSDESYGEGEKGEGCCHGSPCCCGGLPPTWLDWWIERCDMPQHMPYFPTEHGYYYFRPYNYHHIAPQRDFVASFGGDPRNPYDNKIFAQVMADIKAEEMRNQPKAEPIPGPEKDDAKKDDGE